ncbi:MAG: glycosyltransferase [Thermomicrobiales bacterium]
MVHRRWSTDRRDAALAAGLGVQRDVKFWGWVDHNRMPTLLAEADMFLFTSFRDTCPMPALEAMAIGLPIVALNLHGVQTLSDEAVIKVPVKDPDRLVDDVASALMELAASSEVRARRGAAAWRSVRDGHLWNHRYTGVDAAYEAVLGTPVDESDLDEAHGRAAD